MSERAINVANFSGGWNCRDAPSEIADNETPDCLNVTFDERGGVVKRLGYQLLNSTPLSAPANNIFWWPTPGITIVQVGTKLYKTTDFTTFTLLHTFTSPDRTGMSDFQTLATGAVFQEALVICHPIDGTFIYDGTTFSQAGTLGNTIKGNECATWQNRVWVTGVSPRIWACKIGDPTNWDTTITGDDAALFVDIREQDGQKVVALGVGQGFNPVAQGGLLAFKRHSTHRLNTSSSGPLGEFTTLSNMVGAASALSVSTSRTGHICFMGADGVYVTDGVKQPVLMSRKIELLFRPEQMSFGSLDQVCAAPYKDRILFSFPRNGSSTNNTTLEFHPDLGWFAPHSFGFSAMTEVIGADSRVWGTDPATGNVYDTFKGWSDNGKDITCRWQSKWFIPGANVKCRFRRARLEARGLFNTFVKFDYNLGQGELYPVDMRGAGFIWNDPGVDWNEPGVVWGPSAYENYIDLYSLGVGRAISMQIGESSQVEARGPRLLGDGFATEVGSVALYGVRLDFYPLGLS